MTTMKLQNQLRSFIIFYFSLIFFFKSRPTDGRISKLPLTHYFVFGDKFSGVKFLSNILNQTAPSLPLQECKAINPKDGSIMKDQEVATSWRYGFLSVNHLKKNLDCNIDQTLFIMIVKDVRSMICSVAKRKFKITSKKLLEMHLNSLIVHRWDDDDHLDLNGKAYSNNTMAKTYNYLKLRSQKLSNHYTTLSRLKHGVVTRYEDLLQDPSLELKGILRGRGIVLGASIEVSNIINRVNETKLLCHPRFTPTMYSKITRRLNNRIEKKVGYSLIPEKENDVDNGLASKMWALFVDLMWWIIVPTLAIISLVVLPLAFKEIYKLLISSLKGERSHTHNISNSQKMGSAKAQWIEVMERSTGRLYYVNRETGKVQWNRPSHFERYTGIDPIFNKSAEYFARYSKLD